MSALQVEPGTIVLFSDIGCPWASLAVHRLWTRRRELGLDGAVTLDHRAFPLELFNEQVTPKRILDGETAVIGSREPALHWQPWQRAERDYPGSTLLPLAAVQAAKDERVGGLPASEQLDAALRHAWYAESASVHLYAEVLAVARRCDLVDDAALDARLQAGDGFAAVHAQRGQAQQIGVQGSPHLYLPDGSDRHNPGIEMHWSGEQFHGFPVITADDPGCYDDILRRSAAG